MKIKKEKMDHLILRELSLILRDEVHNPALEMCTITAVECTNDLSIAKIYVSFFKNPTKGLEALDKSKGFIRSALSKRLKIRKCPELHFLKDTSLDYGNKIESILNDLNK